MIPLQFPWETTPQNLRVMASAINQVFELNFMEHKSNKLRHEPSKEDRKFLKTSVQGIHWCGLTATSESAYHIIC